MQFQIFCFVNLGLALVGSDASKRILLSDPAYVHTIEVQMQDLTGKISDLASKYNAQGSKLNHLSRIIPKTASGALYTRWGRSSCPGNGTDLVYTGYAGGSLYTDTGGAAEYVCMPKDPVHEFSDLHDTDGRIYGAQYETNFFGSTTSGQRALCSICRSSKRASILMLPGQKSCNAGWTMEYHGIMATGYHDHKGRSQYICLDVDAESEPTMYSYDVGKVLYRVRSKCGSLPCPPFVDSGILSCVVCTK